VFLSKIVSKWGGGERWPGLSLNERVDYTRLTRAAVLLDGKRKRRNNYRRIHEPVTYFAVGAGL